MKTLPSGKVSLSRIVLIAVLTSVFLGVAIWMVIPAPPIGFGWDDAWYMLMAEWLTPDSSFRMLSWAMLRVTSYPPLFPMFIALSGANLIDQQSAFIMNAMLLAFGSGVAMFWFSREGFSAIAMIFAATLVVFNPVSLGYLPILFSEFLFILLSITALTLAARENEWNGKWVVIGIIVGLSIATRSIAWSLAAGFIFHLALNRKLAPVVAFTLGLGGTILVIPFLMVGLPSAAVNYMDQLTGAMNIFSLDFLGRQINGLVLGWSMLWGWGIGAGLAAVAVLPGIFVRLKANRADAWFVLIYLAVLLAWPWPGHMGRFLWPLLPCFLVFAHSSFLLIKKTKYQSVGVGVFMAIILATAIPDGIGRSLERLLDPPEGELSQFSRMHEWTRSSTREEGLKKLMERQQLLQDLQRVSGFVGSNSCIYSDMSALVAVQTRRVSYPILWTTLEEVGLRKVRCEYYYMLLDSLPGTSINDLNRFTATHEEIFRSEVINDSKGKLPFSVFLRFSPVSAK